MSTLKKITKAVTKPKNRKAIAKVFRNMRIAQTAGSLSGPLGAALGKRVDQLVARKIQGRGSYMVGRGLYTPGSSSVDSVNASATIAGGTNNHPHMSSTIDENGMIRFRKREFVTQISATGSADWSNSIFSINPGLASVFPWGSQIAPNYQEYEMVQCIFTYEPVVSALSVSPVGSLGSIVLSTNSNAGAAKFDSFTAAIESGNSVRGTIANTIVLGIECAPNKSSPAKFVRGGAVPAGQDVKTYDIATFQLGLYGVPTQYAVGTQLGLLWVDYEVILRKPLFFDGAGLSINTDWHSSSVPTVGCTNVALLGTTVLAQPNNSIGGRIVNTGAVTKYIFPDNFTGTVLVEFVCVGTGLGLLSINQSASTASWGCTMSDAGVNASNNGVQNGTVESWFIKGLVVDATAVPNDNWISFSYSAITTMTMSYIRVSLANPQVSGLPGGGVPYTPLPA